MFDFSIETINSNTIIYAKWNKSIVKFTVTFNTDSGSTVPSQSVSKGGKASRPTASPSKDDYVFDDWYKDSAKTVVFDFTEIIRGDITLYADWFRATPAHFFEHEVIFGVMVIEKYIGDDAGVVIPKKINGVIVGKIDAMAFVYCESLISVVIPDSVTSIGDSAFSGCSSLISITIPDSVISIGSYAFYYCSSFINITILDGVTNIGDRAFAYCSSLISITIGSSVTSIDDLFYRCSSLTSITIPENITNINRLTFFGCQDLVSIDVESTNKYYSSIKGVLFNKSQTHLICYPSGKTTQIYVIPDSVKNIKDRAFGSCINLTDIIIPYSVTSIGTDAFFYCTNLTDIIIPDSVTSIGTDAFYGCSSLKSVIFQNPNGWSVSSYLGAIDVIVLKLDDPQINAIYLTVLYQPFYWNCN